MESLLAQIKELAKSADDNGRKKILDGLRDLSYSIETEHDTLSRIVYGPTELVVIRIGCDLKLFDILSESSTPMTVAALAEKTGASPLLMGRILRYLASMGNVSETGKNEFAANKIAKLLSQPGFRGGVYHHFDTLNPALQELPDFLKETQYRDITDVVKTPFQKGHKTDVPAFAWAQANPDAFANFNQFMRIAHVGLPTWLDVYPVQARAQALTSPAQPLFVDVGGGLGHQSVALRARLPDVPNRVILQDMAFSIEHAPPHPGVEAMAVDFWQPQPETARGAKMYYMRNIMHDYPDEKAVVLLKNIIDAMAPDSVILIDDQVIPNTGAHWNATQMDFIMMSSLASLERTEDLWYALMEKAGLKINKIYTYTASLGESIIECVPVS